MTIAAYRTQNPTGSANQQGVWLLRSLCPSDRNIRTCLRNELTLPDDIMNRVLILTAASFAFIEEVDAFGEEGSRPLLDSGSTAQKGFLKDIFTLENIRGQSFYENTVSFYCESDTTIQSTTARTDF
ncbi:hypothetical protein STEG23_029233 [Scotinomys teguina]